MTWNDFGIMSEAVQGWNPSTASNQFLTCREVTVMAEADSSRSAFVRVCDGCGKIYKPTINSDGSPRKTKHNTCSLVCTSRINYKAKQEANGIAHSMQCKQCNGPIQSPRIGRLYCCDKCSKAARIGKERQLRDYTRQCVVCGVDYTRTEKAQKTCSDACRRKLKRQLKEKYRRQRGARPVSEIQAAARAKEATIDLWGRNAIQAFDYWIKTKATDDQMARYWMATGKPWLNQRLTDTEKYRIQYRLDIEFQVKERMRRQVNKARKRDGIADVMRSAIKCGGTSRKVERELGYSIADLMRHIERQFTKGMTWEKFKAGAIHVDHITPKSSFDLADDDEWRRCWCLSNLRPLWAEENLRKRDAILFLC